MRTVLMAITMTGLLATSQSWGEEGSHRTTDPDGRGVMPEHGRTTSDPSLEMPRVVVPSAPAPDFGRVPEPISPAPMLPIGPHAAPVMPGSPKAPAISPPSSGGFSTGTGIR
jgi:hypothetical protein